MHTTQSDVNSLVTSLIGSALYLGCVGKSADDADYSAKQAHVELAMRMRKRDAGSAPNLGDRVAYVIIQAAKVCPLACAVGTPHTITAHLCHVVQGAPAYEKSEDPVWVLEHNLPIDTEYYLTNQLSNPLTRIFEPIIPNPQSLITGDHTRTVCKPTPKGGGIMNFAVKKETCMGCRTLVSPQDKVPGTPLCKNCGAREGDIYASKLAEVNAHQKVFNQLWTECQRCQGSFHQEVSAPPTSIIVSCNANEQGCYPYCDAGDLHEPRLPDLLQAQEDPDRPPESAGRAGQVRLVTGLQWEE